MEIKINGKTLIAIIAVSATLAFGNFVSIVNADNAGGVVYATPEYSVGAVVFRADDVNPSTLYGGTWELITGDAAIRLGDGSNLDMATLKGISNTPSVPLPKHSHTRGTMEITGQFGIGGNGGLRVTSTSTSGAFYSGASTSVDGYGGGARTGNSITYFNASRNWSGATSLSGVDNATLDVRGQYVTLNVWKKVL